MTQDAPEAWVVDDVVQREGIVRRVLPYHNPVRAVPRQEIRVDDVELAVLHPDRRERDAIQVVRKDHVRIRLRDVNLHLFKTNTLNNNIRISCTKRKRVRRTIVVEHMKAHRALPSSIWCGCPPASENGAIAGPELRPLVPAPTPARTIIGDTLGGMHSTYASNDVLRLF